MASLIIACVAAYIAWRTYKLDNLPALLIEVEQTPREGTGDRHEDERRWGQLSTVKRFGGLKITNKGRGVAVLKELHYAGETASLDNAFLAANATFCYPCTGLIEAVEKAANKNCTVLYSDLTGKEHKQFFRLNLEAMCAVPLHCE